MKKKNNVRFKITSLCGRYELRRGTHPKSPGFYIVDKKIKGTIKLLAVFPSFGSITLAKCLIRWAAHTCNAGVFIGSENFERV